MKQSDFMPACEQKARRGEVVVPLGNRSGRLIQKESSWYFRTRGGSCVGPYESAADALASVQLFVGFLNRIKPESIPALIETMNRGRLEES